jgi:hypothetical protein
MASDIGETPAPPTTADLAAREAHSRRAHTGEAETGLWQRVHFRRAVVEGTAIFALWRLLELVPISFWPAALFPIILLALLVLRFLPPVWASLRLIATRREKMSRRFFWLAGILATTCFVADSIIALAVGDPAQPFGGPAFGPDLPRFFAAHHHLTLGAFLGMELATYGLLLAYFLIATICTRLAQGGFLRFTMPSGNGRVTL